MVAPVVGKREVHPVLACDAQTSGNTEHLIGQSTVSPARFECDNVSCHNLSVQQEDALNIRPGDTLVIGEEWWLVTEHNSGGESVKIEVTTPDRSLRQTFLASPFMRFNFIPRDA